MTLAETIRGHWDFHLAELLLEITAMRKENVRLKDILKSRRKRARRRARRR